MCGIAGFTTFHSRLGDEATLDAMGEAMKHRGPDSEGSWLDEHCGIHHRRLAIIDLSESGRQPMHSVCGRYVIVFNGEIYNFQELREDLVNRGYQFASTSDTEVILALYDELGRECLQKLNGMFALAIWDREARRLFAARDRVGKKPFYYTFVDGDIAFASELKALLGAGLVDRKLRLDALRDYFAYQYVPDPKTIFDGVHKLEPGHWLEVTIEGAQSEQYWNLSYDVEKADAQSITRLLEEEIARATRQRMISDVPLGAFLSGGVDSSGVVATMAKSSSSPVTTCSIGFDEEKYDETVFAQLVADQYDTDHHKMIVNKTVRENVEQIAAFFDEPFADPSLVPTFFVSELARKHVTVALSGDGGDEVFAGYLKYRIDAMENRWRSMIPGVIRRILLPPIARVLGHSAVTSLRRASTLLKAMAVDPAMGFFLSNAQVPDEHWDALVKPDVTASLKSYHPSEVTLRHYRDCDAKSHMDRLLYTDIKTYLVGDILVKVDRMSMAHSLEVRAPLLDYKILEASAKTPVSLKSDGRDLKIILKRIFSKSLPEPILSRKKMGFSPPIDTWLRVDLLDIAEKLLLGSSSGIPDFFDVEGIRHIWNQHQGGSDKYGITLWTLFMFQLWWNEYMLET